MRGLRAFFAVATVLASLPALAQAPAPGPDTDPVAEAAAAVRLAKAAFEYRDFQKVVDTLDPWLHPPRIVDDALEVRARELLGVSLHVLGKPDAAADEFALLLKLDPDHELDPFVVPPRVMQTFEEVRAKMKPALDARRRDNVRSRPLPEAKAQVETRVISLPNPAFAFLPFGVPQFAAEEPAWGLFWASAQTATLALNIVAYVLARRELAGPSFDAWRITQYASLAAFAGTWAGGSAHGLTQIQALRARAEADSATPPRTLSFTWHF